MNDSRNRTRGLGSGVWGLAGAGTAALIFISNPGCSRHASASAAQLARQDAENLRQAKILREKAAALRADIPAIAEELAQVRVREARLTLRQQARNNGRYHLVLDDEGTRLRFFNGSRPIGVMPVSRVAMPSSPAASSVSSPMTTGANLSPTEFPPGAYRLRRIETLKSAQPGPRVPGRKATAGGNCRLYFGDEKNDLWFISTARAPNQPPAPKLPRWNLTSGALDSLAAALKPDDLLFIPAAEDRVEAPEQER